MNDILIRHKLLKQQAATTAKQLGHILTDFVTMEDSCKAYCLQCDLDLSINPRNLNKPSIGGGCISLTCQKDKQPETIKNDNDVVAPSMIGFWGGFMGKKVTTP